MNRRRALIAAVAEENPEYTSSTGKKYRKYHTVSLLGITIVDWLASMGLMDNLEELTITGSVLYQTSNNNIGAIISTKIIWSNYAPNLKKLFIIPTYIAGGGSVNRSMFNFGHYAFSGLPKLTVLQLGGLASDGYCYFNVGGYFRDDNGTKTVGTAAGLHLDSYRTSYNALGGFANGTKASNTTITVYNKDTGSVITS